MLRGAVDIARLFSLEVPGIVVLIFSCLIGWTAEVYLPPGPWTGLISVFLAYHLFLAWLVCTEDHDYGFRVPIVFSILTHLACVAAVCGLAMSRYSIPLYAWIQMIPGFGLLRYGIAALALFERDLIFSGRSGIPGEGTQREPAVHPLLIATGEEHEQWLRYLAQGDRSFRRAGLSLSGEYDHWLRSRHRRRAMQPAANRYASGD